MGSPILKMPIIRNKVDVSKLRLLAETAPLTHLPWAVRHDLDPDLIRQLVTALLDLNQSEAGRHILKQARLTGLYPVRDADYDAHRALLRKVRPTQKATDR